MTYMLTHVFLGMTPIVKYLAHVASSQRTSERTKTAEQDSRVTLEVITIEVNSKQHNLMSMLLNKLNVSSY